MMMIIILTTTYMQVTLNRWNAPFYQAIQDRDLDSFIGQLIIFAYIAAALTILNVTQTFVSKRLSISIRRGLVSDLLEKWLIDNGGRELHLLGSPLAEHADQRIHSDVRSLAETTTGLAVGLVQSVILLASFVTILWTLSPEFQFNVLNYDLILPGYLVWAALFYAGLTSGLNRLVGRHLVELNSLREAREAEFRTSLVQADMALHANRPSSESDEAITFKTTLTFAALLDALKRIAVAETNLVWVSGGFGWLAIVVPIIAAAPAYFSGNLDFGGLMMAVGAFNQVHGGLRWNVNNFLAIAEWKAHLARVTQFRKALTILSVQ